METSYKMICDYPDCGQHIEFDAEHLNTMTNCPSCGRSILLGPPVVLAVPPAPTFKDRLKTVWRFVKPALHTLWQIVAAIGSVLWFVISLIGTAIREVFLWVNNHLIGLIGICFMVGAVFGAIFSPVLVTALVLIAGCGFGFVLGALDGILNQLKKSR